MTSLLRSFICSLTLLCLALPGRAGTELSEGKQMMPPGKNPPAASPFAKGMRELQLGVSGYFSFANHSETKPHLDDIGASARLGWMLSDPKGSGFWRGNREFLVEVWGSGIVEGPGNGLAGMTLMLRHNFVPLDSNWAPYFQIGAGGAYSDAHEESPQRLLGSAVSFNLQVGFGTRYFVSERCAVFIEANYRHLSNASFADRNVGLNSAGAVLGASYFF